MHVKVNVDIFKLLEATLQSVDQDPDEDEEMLFKELYKELLEIDTRATQSQRGRGRGIRVGGGRNKGLLVHRTSASVGVAEGGIQTYARRGSSSSNPVAHDDYGTPPLPREQSFDDENLLSHSGDEDVIASHSSYEESSANSLDEHFNTDRSVDDSSSDVCS